MDVVCLLIFSTSISFVSSHLLAILFQMACVFCSFCIIQYSFCSMFLSKCFSVHLLVLHVTVRFVSCFCIIFFLPIWLQCHFNFRFCINVFYADSIHLIHTQFSFWQLYLSFINIMSFYSSFSQWKCSSYMSYFLRISDIFLSPCFHWQFFLSKIDLPCFLFCYPFCEFSVA